MSKLQVPTTPQKAKASWKKCF